MAGKTEKSVINQFYSCACRDKVTHHSGKEQELCKKHEEFKKQFQELDEQFELVSKDSTSLENSFDELHKHYLKLKVIHRKLVEGSKILNQHLAELRAWDDEDTNYASSLQQELQEIEMRCDLHVCVLLLLLVYV